MKAGGKVKPYSSQRHTEKGQGTTDTRFMENRIETMEKMLHGEADAKVELRPGKGRIIIPGDWQPCSLTCGSSALRRVL